MKRRKRRKKGAHGHKERTAWGTDVPPAPFYDFRELLRADPALRRYLRVGEMGEMHTDVQGREARLALTIATLRHFFSLSFSLPAGQLVPVIPGRVQYLRWAASLLPAGAPTHPLTVIDVGTGPSAIYSLLGARLFAPWRFVATDADPDAIAVARGLVAANLLGNSVRVVHTPPDQPLLHPALWHADPDAPPALTLCNPPFFEAVPHGAEARDLRELRDAVVGGPAGTDAQLITQGGELEFVSRLARDSVAVPDVGIFTSLVGVLADLPAIVAYIRGEEVRAAHVVTVTLDSGGRTKRWAVAWHFGPTFTKIDVAAPQAACEWRAPLSVLPGRRYANRMTSPALMAVWRCAMLALGWTEEQLPSGSASRGDGERVGASQGGAASSARRAKLETCLVTKLLNGCGEMTLICAKCGRRNYDGTFSLMIAVERRGGLAAYEVFHIATAVVREMCNLMNVE